MPTKNASGADNQQERSDPSWIVGFIDGEGCFSVSLVKNKTYKSGYQVFPEFVVTQGAKSLKALEYIKNFFGCGNIYVNRRYDNHREHIYRYCVRSLKDLDLKIIPFFMTNPLRTTKAEDFSKLSKIIALMKEGIHLSSEGLNTVCKIASEMNYKKIRRSGILRGHTPDPN